MNRYLLLAILSLLFVMSIPLTGFAQPPARVRPKSLEVSDKEGIPVIIKHLPNWKEKQNSAVFIQNFGELRKVLGDRDILQYIDFVADTEGVTADYPEGKLLIVEYSTPQASIDTDKKVSEFLAATSTAAPVFYKRIGNYNAFVFDAADEASANQLFKQIKYEKVVRWLNYDPFIADRAERAFITQTKDLFIATVFAILLGLLVAIIAGIIAGIVFYNIRKSQRATMVQYSDGGGLTRLNLDQLTPDTNSDFSGLR